MHGVEHISPLVVVYPFCGSVVVRWLVMKLTTMKEKAKSAEDIPVVHFYYNTLNQTPPKGILLSQPSLFLLFASLLHLSALWILTYTLNMLTFS